MADGSIDVLIVDDDPAVAVSTAAVLESAGLVALVAPSLDAAEAVLATTAVGAVILDHNLGASRLGPDCPVRSEHPPVIVVSGIGRDALDCLRREHGGRLFATLAKPVAPRRLIDVVERAVGERYGRDGAVAPGLGTTPVSSRSPSPPRG
jgi:DNA-binding NtrC family response regulator